MDHSGSIPLPGQLQPVDEAVKVVNQLYKLYKTDATDDSRAILPAWCSFPKGREVSESIFEQPGFQDENLVYFYREGLNSTPPTLYLATPKEVLDFFQRRQPWQDKDYYIIATSYKWCIVVTHEDNIFIVNV